ncbi:MAG: hypothetical protein K0B10_01270 [Vicingaceae bacterium]|nr:hypothetical protein [Vicingaceae bacterium]
MKLLKEQYMRQTNTGHIYMQLADIFDMSEENRKKLDVLLDEPDNETEYAGADIDWLIKVEELFPIIEEDKYLWYGELWRVVKDNMNTRKQMSLN